MAKFTILFEDNNLIAVDKPAGLSTQPTEISQVSLETDVKAFIKDRDNKPGNVFLHAIHRLDKQVSGVVVFAKSSKALSRLQEEIRMKRTYKKYVALLEGKVKLEKGTLKHILIHGEHKALLGSSTEGKDCTLSYQVLQSQSDATFVEIELDTGRYHQIRAQWSLDGHPIKGDKKYGAKTLLPGGAIALHHLEFQIQHPTLGKMMTFKALPPFQNWEVPASWQALLAKFEIPQSLN